MKKYYFKEKLFKIRDRYYILDENGKKSYYLDQDFKLVGYSATVTNLTNDKQMKIVKKLLNLLPKYEVYFSDRSMMEVRARLAFLRRKVDLYYKDENIRLKGKIMDFNFDVYNEKELIGSLDKKILSLADQYQLTVFDEKYSDLLVALTLIVDNIKNTESAANNSGGE